MFRALEVLLIVVTYVTTHSHRRFLFRAQDVHIRITHVLTLAGVKFPCSTAEGISPSSNSFVFSTNLTYAPPYELTTPEGLQIPRAVKRAGDAAW